MTTAATTTEKHMQSHNKYYFRVVYIEHKTKAKQNGEMEGKTKIKNRKWNRKLKHRRGNKYDVYIVLLCDDNNKKREKNET